MDAENQLKFDPQRSLAPSAVNPLGTPAAVGSIEHSFRELTEALPLLVWTCRADGTCDYLSPQWSQYTGRPLHPLRADGLAEAVHPDDRRHMQTKWEQALSREEPYEFEFRVCRADGVYRWFKARGTPIFNEHGMLARWIGTCSDVQEQKQLEETLREHDKRLHLALSASKMGVWEWKPQNDHFYLSFECLAMLGIESFGRTLDAFVEFVHPDDRSLVRKLAQRVLIERQPYSAVFRLRDVNGTVKWVHNLGQAECDRLGHITRVLGTFRDVTGEREAAEELREKQARLRDTFENLIVGCQILDHDLRYVYLNANAALHGRRRREELLGQRMVDVYPGIQKTPLYNSIIHCLRTRTSERMDNEFNFPDGTVGIFELSIQSVPEGVLIVSADVTQERELAAKLLQSQKLEAVGRLAGGVAHDFNNLLTVINGHCDLLQIATSPAVQAESIAAIRSAGERAARLTSQLLSLSRNAFVNTELVDINQTLEKSRNFIRSLIGDTICLTMRLAADIKRVRIDPAQFEQVVMNLVINARDAMPTGGELTITTMRFQLDESPQGLLSEMLPGEYVYLQVTDTGMGMTAEVRSRIFEPFFTTKEVGRGTGLGLPVVHGAVKQAGGHVTVDSEVGVGTSFHLFYPCDPEIEAASMEEQSGQGESLNSRILLVEDEDPVRVVVRMSLEQHGCEVIECSGPEQALHSASVSPAVDLLVTDVVMPNMRGPELAQALRRLQPDLRVLYMSGYADESIDLKSALRSDDDFLQKPFSPVELVRRVRQLLARDK